MSSNSTLATAGFRLSLQQEWVWTQHERGLTQYAQCLILATGELEPTRLERALGRVVEKHEILRTRFRRHIGVKLPFQVIVNDVSFRFQQINQADASLDRLMEQERAASRNLDQDPPLRAALLTSNRQLHHLILTLPALCADAVTLSNLVGEVAAAYNETLGDSPVMQYADLVEWQNELLASDETKAGRDFWRALCRDLDFAALDSTTLPLEQKADTAFSPATISLPSSLSGDIISRAAKSLETSDDDLLLAAWSALLLRLTGQQALTLGCEFAGRRYEELASALGPLSRSLPIGVAASSESSFRTLLEDVQTLTRNAQSWQESFAWNQVAKTEMPALPFTFACYHADGAHAGAQVSFSLERLHVLSEPFKLRLVVVRHAAELAWEFHYDASRLTRAAIELIAGYYQNLLTAALAKPDTAVWRIPLLSENQRRQLLIEWNSTQTEYPERVCLHQLFEDQTARTPERIAVRSGEQAYSYRELNERANQLAHYLRAHGVGADRLVGICLERSANAMVAVLAILKAGGAYVPLNPDNPPARLKQQIQQAAAIITESLIAAQIPTFFGPESPAHTVLIDRDGSRWADQPKTNPAVNTCPQNLVYVIYTSGSTGVPKGVAVRHRNLVNYANFIRERLELRNHPEGLQFATVSTLGADLGNTCIYPALISGGTVHVIPFEMSTDAKRLAAYVAQHPVDVLKIVPSHLQALLEYPEAAKLLPSKYLIFGGETLTPKLLNKIESLSPTCEILNHYGPTETTVGSLTLKLKDYDWRKAKLASIPIGKPIHNTQVYILDQNLEPVPMGVTGELYIAGAGVTAGYLGQPEKTEERFLQNPFIISASAKMYRTGDLARYLADGNVEFLGRSDDQVKVRGFRIELGEIETVLARQAAVKQTVVVAREDRRGEKRLVAYVVLNGESMGAQQLRGEVLRTSLKNELPDYMIPQSVVVMPRLPLNSNGKIDRQSLPEPDETSPPGTYVAPRSLIEETILAVWAEVLRRDKSQISIEDNFFDLGGHSLLATQVVSRLRRALNIELPLRMLFEFPTVRRLAEQAQEVSPPTSAERPPIVPVPRDQALLLSFAQQRLWVLDQIDPNNSLYNVPRAMRLKGSLNIKALTDSLNEIVRRHESLRTTFAQGTNGAPVQACADSVMLAVPMIDLSGRPAEEREPAAREMAAREAHTAFDLAQGPLLRAKLLRLDAEDHVLLLTMHHIVSDAWSAGVFFQELGTLYSAYLEGRPSPLPELPIQYADYAMWQRNWLEGKVLEDQLDYWREHLRGAPPLIELPSDRPRPEVRSFAGAHERLSLSNQVAEGVQTFSHEQGVTVFMTLLAAFKALLARYSGQQHIVVGTDIANRTTAETERLIGFFINLLPLHTDLSGDPSFRELVGRVREVALGAYAHQDIPFDKLVEDLQPERKLSHNPVVQVLFVMQNVPAIRHELPGLELDAFGAPVTHSKFDLAVFIQESAAATIGHWVYSTELFARETILRLASHFETLLLDAISRPDTRLSALEIYSAEEKQEQEREQSQRKQSQRRRLMAVEPKAVQMTEGDQRR